MNCLGFSAYVHDEVCAKILCSKKELVNLKDSKLIHIFMAIRLVLSDWVTNLIDEKGATSVPISKETSLAQVNTKNSSKSKETTKKILPQVNAKDSDTSQH